jgi:hypothetical protein
MTEARAETNDRCTTRRAGDADRNHSRKGPVRFATLRIREAQIASLGRYPSVIDRHDGTIDAGDARGEDVGAEDAR